MSNKNPDVLLARLMASAETIREFHVEEMRMHTIDDGGIDEVETLLAYIDALHQHIVAGGKLPVVWEEGPKLEVNPDALKMFGKLEERLGSDELQSRLDELVHELKSKEASSLNNSGADEQWSWVVRQIGLHSAEKAITLDEEPLYP